MGSPPANKLPDEVAACNMIKNARIYSKRFSKKTHTVRIGKDVDGYIISAVLKLTFNPSTDHIALAHPLSYKTTSIYPSTNKKLVCTNSHALEQLDKRRGYERKRRAERKAK